MSGWRKCDRCRKVRQVDQFDAGSPSCRDCLTAPATRRTPAPVTTRSAPSPAPTERRTPRGLVGLGDVEVRERRAKRAAYEALAQSHPEEFEVLLRDARQAEGLRS